MEFVSNNGKKVEIEVNEVVYLRHAIKTRFIKPRRKLYRCFYRIRKPNI